MDQFQSMPTNVEFRGEILRHISDGRILPVRHFYDTSDASACWLELSRESRTEYDFYGQSIAAVRRHSAALVDHVVAATGTAQINFVCVGCGDGVKDNILLHELDRKLGDGENIGYYALDISQALVAEAVVNAVAGLNPGHVCVESIVADYSTMKQHLGDNLSPGSAPKLFAVLGNTVGNADEQQLMDAISEAMNPGDLVLLEVNIGTPDLTDPFWSTPGSLAHYFDFLPLAAFNVPFVPAQMRFSQVEKQSVIAGTKSVLISYRDAELGGEIFDEVKLFLMHYYDQQNFIPAIERQMSVTVLWAEAVRDVFLVLAAADR
jgi:uncharacterized SAM-dependent methyltransferase